MEKNKFYHLLAICLVVSFLVGGISGAAFSILAKKISFEPIAKLFNTITDEKNETKIVKVEEESATIDAVKKVSPSVVSIIISKDLSKYNNTSLPEWFPFSFSTPAPETKEGLQEVGGGSGFIISDDGYVFTNKHVVMDQEAEYTVVTSDGTEYKAKVVATDLINDIAVLKVDAKNLTPVSLGDSDSLEIGQTVIAIGNALSEYHNTVTKGVVSGINRSVQAGDGSGFSEMIEGAIQTDAAINPGNSGGPLINLSGEVIGVNTAVSQEGQLVGFAIPINIAKKVISDVKQYGKIMRPYLGVRYAIINEKIAKANNLDQDYGALIIRGETNEELAVIPGSPADKAGLVENDIILEVNGKKVTEDEPLAEILSSFKPNDEITLTVLKKGEKKEIKVVLAEAPAN